MMNDEVFCDFSDLKKTLDKLADDYKNKYLERKNKSWKKIYDDDELLIDISEDKKHLRIRKNVDSEISDTHFVYLDEIFGEY